MSNVELHLGGCLEIMRGLPPGSVDAVVTDPPFFAPATHYQSRIQWSRKFSDLGILTEWWGLVCDAFRPLLKPTGHALVFCNADAFAAFYPAMFNRWDRLASIVWDKTRPGMGRVWRHQHELVLAARDRGAFEHNDGRLRADVIQCGGTRGRDREHPVEKPEALLAELVEACVPVGGVVLDPFMGSGSTGSAALSIGRSFVGIEQDPDYFAIAEARIARARGEFRATTEQGALDLGAA